MNQEEKIPDLLLEKYLLGELPARLSRRLKERIAADPQLQARIEELGRSNRAILERYPAVAMADAIREKERMEASRETARRPLRMRPALLAVPVLALLLVVFLPPLLRNRDETRFKGDRPAPELLVFRRGAGGEERLSGGDRAAPGDLLQLAYRANGATHGVILSIDGGGRVTLHYPESVRGSTILSPDRRTLLPEAFELDDAPGFERFFLVTGDRLLDLPGILRRAWELASDRKRAREGRLDLPDGLHQVSVLLSKETRR